MADPFAAALAVLFMAPGSAAAVYTPPAGAPVNIRVVQSQASAIPNQQIVVDTMLLDIRKSDVALPVVNATVAIGGITYKLNAAPLLDVEGLTWRCGAVPA